MSLSQSLESSQFFSRTSFQDSSWSKAALLLCAFLGGCERQTDMCAKPSRSKEPIEFQRSLADQCLFCPYPRGFATISPCKSPPPKLFLLVHLGESVLIKCQPGHILCFEAHIPSHVPSKARQVVEIRSQKPHTEPRGGRYEKQLMDWTRLSDRCGLRKVATISVVSSASSSVLPVAGAQ